jgi:hypothetical protein
MYQYVFFFMLSFASIFRNLSSLKLNMLIKYFKCNLKVNWIIGTCLVSRRCSDIFYELYKIRKICNTHEYKKIKME